MRWLFRAPGRLKELGIMGLNRRNAEFILDRNPRSLFPLVDDKLRMRDLCRQIGVPTPRIIAEIASQSSLSRLEEFLGRRTDFVLKPNRGSGGRGILVFTGRTERYFLRHSGERLRLDQVHQHLADILSGMYSLGGRPDSALVQQRVRLHSVFRPIAYKGIPDIRIILYRNQPAMAMLRLPTKTSNGRANLHQGGIGTGVDLIAGVTTHAVQRNRSLEVHPDTGHSLIGLRVPYWSDVVGMARKVAEAVGLGYLGVDIVIDQIEGPMLLEANARPGLAIQIANGCGLLPRLREIDDFLSRSESEPTTGGGFPVPVAEPSRLSA
jgi:alpha-L-glutamate ligase-like protein